MNCKFINIDRVRLMPVDYSDQGEEIVSKARHLSYNGTGHKDRNDTWVEFKCKNKGKCSVSSVCLPPPTPHLSLKKTSALLADCGALVAGLRLCGRRQITIPQNKHPPGVSLSPAPFRGNPCAETGVSESRPSIFCTPESDRQSSPPQCHVQERSA